jgi:hypothetical protein
MYCIMLLLLLLLLLLSPCSDTAALTTVITVVQATWGGVHLLVWRAATWLDTSCSAVRAPQLARG